MSISSSERHIFDDVIWSDECTVQMETHRRFCCRKKGEPPKPKPSYIPTVTGSCRTMTLSILMANNGVNWWRQSPDINPIENLWHELKEYIRREVKPKVKQELVDGIRAFWETAQR
ncbi:hypothetical protein EMCRGX_G030327 [Ephydatia muelleri]